jgi:phosphate transport system protein
MATNLGEHIVSSYEDELTNLARSISEMGGVVEVAVGNDKQIDEMQRRIDETAVSMIARRQPMARDLRAIITSIHVANDLERIGDMAKTISRRTLQIEGLSLAPKFYNGVKHMSDLILRQLKAALDAYSNRNAQAAVEICNADDEIDALYTSLFRELLTYMMEDPRNITQCTHLLFCSKSLERVGDHATNIAESAFYLETGEQMAVHVEDLRRTQIKE